MIAGLWLKLASIHSYKSNSNSNNNIYLYIYYIEKSYYWNRIRTKRIIKCSKKYFGKAKTQKNTKKQKICTIHCKTKSIRERKSNNKMKSTQPSICICIPSKNISVLDFFHIWIDFILLCLVSLGKRDAFACKSIEIKTK